MIIQDVRTSLDMEPQTSELLKQEPMGLDEQIWGVGSGQNQRSHRRSPGNQAERRCAEEKYMKETEKG